jgi:ATP-dependent Lon protease
MTDALDAKANDAFPGRVVRKDLVRRVKVGANVPVYVLEYLLGKYCATDDPAAIEVGLRVVNETLTENFVWPDEAQKAQAGLKRRGTRRIIDRVTVRFVETEKKFWAEFANFGSRYVHVPEEIVYRYDRLLQGGVWAQVDLVYNDAEEESRSARPFYIEALKPIQVAAFSMEEYREGRARFTRDEWLDLIVRSVGMEPTHFDHRLKLFIVTRLIPMAERNYNLIELGPRGTGKSFVYRETSPNAILISGGKTTVPQLFVHLGTGRLGLVGMWDVVAFDEVAGIQFGDSTVVQMLKDYMESGSFARGKEELPAEAAMVFLGNIDLPAETLVKTSHLFADLPKAMIDAAFLDRLHYYLPGWEVPKLEQRFFTDHYGFVSDYLSEALSDSRRFSFADALENEFAFGPHLNARDERAVKKTISGLLKILHPDGQWTRAELREYLEFAMEGRRRVKEQLKKLAPHEYGKTAFSYIDRDAGLEAWVEVPEQPDEIEEEIKEVEAEQSPPVSAEVSISDLIMAGESKVLEFKATARINGHTGSVDKEIEHSVVKSVAGFMNAAGGVLLIGVGDTGTALGLDADLATLGRRDLDGYENWLTTLLETSIGGAATANASINFPDVDGVTICRVLVRPGGSPAYVHMKDDEWLYVRLGNSTRRLSTREAVVYIRQRWGA